jgi:DNA repair protein RecO (recombination protein O)
MLVLSGDNLFAGFYLNELLINFLQKDDPHPALFAIYENTLSGLQGPMLDEKIIRSFEKKLLDELGYGLFPKSHDEMTKLWQPDALYQFMPKEGWVKRELRDLVASNLLFTGKTLHAIANENWSEPEILQQAKRLMRYVLTDLMSAKPIYTRQLFLKKATCETVTE